MSRQIIVTKGNEAGGITIDSLTGQVTMKADERPEWADGLAQAMLAERSGWYEQRLGNQLTADFHRPEQMVFEDLEWLAVDAEGDEVHIEADGEYRMETLSNLMNIDREDFEGQKNFQNALVSREVDHTYRTEPTDEATLEEVEGVTFDQAAKAVNE